MQQTCLPQRTSAPSCASRSRSARVARRSAVICRAQKQDAEQAMLSRREGLLAAAAGLVLANGVASAPALAADGEKRLVTKYIQPDNLSVFQRQGQKQLMLTRAITELKKVVNGGDAPDAVRAVLHDAMTYDVATGTGGVNGSIVLPEELDRPENQSLKPYIQKLAVAKKEIDAGAAAIGQAPISWADLLVVAGRVTTQQSWVDIKIGRATLESGGRTIAENFATEFPVVLGRVDSGVPDPAGRLPPTGASVEEIRDFMLALAAKPQSGFIKTKAPFWERPTFVLVTAAAPVPADEEARFAAAVPEFVGLKKKYDLSRNTVTRTDYEVDFVDYFTKLANLGAKFDSNRYLFPIELQVPKNGQF